MLYLKIRPIVPNTMCRPPGSEPSRLAVLPLRRGPGHGGGEGGWAGKRLVHDAVAFRERQQLRHLLLAGVGDEPEAEPDRPAANGGPAVHRQGPPEVEAPRGAHGPPR